MTMKFQLLLLTAIFTVLTLSCNKNKNEVRRTLGDDATVYIDSLTVTNFETIDIKASYVNNGVLPVYRRGICWSKNPDPEIADSSRFIHIDSSFKNTIFNAGRRETFYFRAFILSATDTVYSENKTIRTGSLETLWDKEVTNGQYRSFLQVEQTSDNGFIGLLTGINTSISTKYPALIKYDNSGNVQWSTSFFQTDYKEPKQLIIAGNNYFFTSTHYYYDGRGVYLSKIGPNGALDWEKGFNRSKFQDFIRLSPLPGSQIMLSTRNYSGYNNGLMTDGYIHNFIIDYSGNVVTEDSVPVNANFALGGYTAIHTNTPNNGFLTNVQYYTSQGAGWEILLQQYNNAAQLQWEKLYTNGGTNYATKVIINKDGHYTLLGSTHAVAGVQCNWLFALDKDNGTKFWDFKQHLFRHSVLTSQNPQSFMQNNNGDYLVASGGYEAGIVTKVSSTGQFRWEYFLPRLASFPNSGPNEIITGTDNEFYLFGTRLTDQSAHSTTLFISKMKEYE